MTSHVALSKTNGTPLLFKFLAAVCVLDSVGASSTPKRSTATSSAQPPTISGVPSPNAFAGPVRPARQPRSPPSTFTTHPHRHRSLSSPPLTILSPSPSPSPLGHPNPHPHPPGLPS
eukprot:scaffold14901_cov67-Phaeocystis_antarctica.AAC.4